MNQSEIATFYCCGVSWQHEMGETKIRFFRTKQQCIEHYKCSEECGVVEIRCRVKWVVKQNLPDGVA